MPPNFYEHEDGDATSEEVQQVIREMGYQVPDGFHLNERDLTRRLGDVTAHNLNNTLFSGLHCENLPETSLFCNPPSAVKLNPEDISLADVSTLDEKQEDFLKKLLHKGYDCLNRMMEEIEYIDEKLSARKQSEPAEVAADAEPIVIRTDAEPGPFREVNGNAEDVVRARKKPQPQPMNPALRPVLPTMRAPGRAAFKHDPVKRHEMYMKEWLANPPPGEKKRLALRWKVREYMLRKDAPIFKLLSDKPPEKPEWVN